MISFGSQMTFHEHFTQKNRESLVPFEPFCEWSMCGCLMIASSSMLESGFFFRFQAISVSLIHAKSFNLWFIFRVVMS